MLSYTVAVMQVQASSIISFVYIKTGRSKMVWLSSYVVPLVRGAHLLSQGNINYGMFRLHQHPNMWRPFWRCYSFRDQVGSSAEISVRFTSPRVWSLPAVSFFVSYVALELSFHLPYLGSLQQALYRGEDAQTNEQGEENWSKQFYNLNIILNSSPGVQKIIGQNKIWALAARSMIKQNQKYWLGGQGCSNVDSWASW